MHSRLNQIKNLPELAAESNYSATSLARRCKVSLRHLERFFQETKGTSPHQWLNELRQQEALDLVRTGCLLMKEVAAHLRYKQASHFSREFKRYHGVSPLNIGVAPAQMSLLDKEMSHLDK